MRFDQVVFSCHGKHPARIKDTDEHTSDIIR
jgi:hypothetical protein